MKHCKTQLSWDFSQPYFICNGDYANNDSER